MKEISDIQKGSDLCMFSICAFYLSLQLADLGPALAVAFRDANVRHVRALIVGPADTPYEFGFFGVSSESLRQLWILLTFFS